jgi:hypothetical protein
MQWLLLHEDHPIGEWRHMMVAVMPPFEVVLGSLTVQLAS